MASPSIRDPHSPRRLTAALLSAVLHVGILALVLLAGGAADGVREHEAASSELVLIAAPGSQPHQTHPAGPSFAAVPAPLPPEDPGPWAVEPPLEGIDSLSLDPPPVPEPKVEIPDVDIRPAVVASVVDDASPVADASPAEPVLVMSKRQASQLVHHLERLAEALLESDRAHVSWQQDERTYEAELVREPARDGSEPERALAVVSTEEQGRQMRTVVSLKRLPFSHYAKVIDRWDPMVQLHDDEIIGRVHINSRFNLLFDAQATPRLLGKVTTAAGGFHVEGRGRFRDSEIFARGVETGAGRIPLSRQSPSPDWAGDAAGGRVHELSGDAELRFLGEEGYAWRDGESREWQHVGPPIDGPVYFVATRGTIVRLKGVVSGRFLVFSPTRIVVQGSLTYARDPRIDPRSGDYLGLVCDRDIEVAPPHVTGRGDLHIHAAMFARRRVVVAAPDQPRTATLDILGSLAAGSMTESEPRFAMRVEHDPRFDSVRPPGFPSTNRFSSEDWNGRWTEVPEDAGARQSAGESP